MIATLVNAAALAAKAATTTTPIVFLVSEDPVRLGLFASLARPGGNMTGVNVLFAELVAKRLGLLHDLVPKAVRVAVLVNPTNTANAEATLREIPEAARGLGLQIQVIHASTSREIDAAFATVVRERADALFVAPDITGPITEGRVLINAGGPDVRFRRITGHRKTTLNSVEK